MYMKFQPTPTSTSATQKCATSTPFSATATQATFSAAPTRMMLSTPKRLISDPATSEGANMPITCEDTTNAASPKGWPQIPMAIGVAVISRFITP